MNLKRFFIKRKRDAELVREIEAHIAHEIDEYLARGLSSEEAHRQAYLKFGSPRRVREAEWEFNTLRFFDDLWRDFRYSARTLWRTPGFALVAVIVMALGIGANTAIFTVVRSVLLKPLPFKDPDRLIQLYEKSADNRHLYNYVAGGMYAAWKKQAPSIEQMGIYGTRSVNLSDNGLESASGGNPKGGPQDFELDIVDVSKDPSDPPPAVPEPSTLALFGTGILGAAGAIRRRLMA